MFGFFFKKESGTTVMAQSAYDGANWIAYNKLNYSTKELQYKEGLVNVNFLNSGNILFNNTGNIQHNYTGTGNGLLATGYTPYALYWVGNNYSGDGWALCAGMNSTSATSLSYGLYGFNYGSGYGVYGDATTLGTGVHGVNGGSLNYGALGTYTNGVYGYLNSSNLGDYAIYGYRSSYASGNGYGCYNALGGVKGYGLWGNAYTFGVAGYSFLDDNRSGGNLGYSSTYGVVWGCMAYRSSGSTLYGGYFTSQTTGGGKAEETAINNGIGAWGDLFGATITGGIYGTFTRGEHYASYDHGTSFKDGLDVHLQKNEENTNTVLYTSVSTDVTVQTCGYGQLADGKCIIAFNKAFTEVLSREKPVIVTVTPVGDCKGIHLADIDASGFSVEENETGKSSVKFTYIAIGQRAGYEEPKLPEEVVQSDYIDKVEKSLVDDGSTKGDSPGLYYENGQLITGTHPSMLPDPNKPKVDQNTRSKIVPSDIDKGAIGNGKAPETIQSTVTSPKSSIPVSGIPDKH
jgi:hypothetical protein